MLFVVVMSVHLRLAIGAKRRCWVDGTPDVF